jgi:hypothetical protein
MNIRPGAESLQKPSEPENGHFLVVLNIFAIKNSMFIGFNELVNKGGGAAGFGEKGNPAKLKSQKLIFIQLY